MDVDAGSGTQLVRPADRSGVVVHFGVQKNRAALLRLVDDAGQPLPIGTTIERVGGGAAGSPVPVGYGGEAFMRDLPPHVVLRATLPGQGSCAVAFDYDPRPGDVPTIPLRCTKAGP
jgi:outer membrane usher protein